MKGALTDPDAQERERLFADRWSGYGAHSGILHLSKKPSPSDLRRYEIFQPYDEAFLKELTPDISVATWKADTILFEEGSYLDLAFYVIEGAVDVYLKKDEDASIPPIFDATRVTEEQLMEAALDAGADDIISAGGAWEVTCPPRDFHTLRAALVAAGLEPDSAEVTMLPQTTVACDAVTAAKVLRLIDALEDNDDVQKVYHNADMPEEAMTE